MSTAEDLRIPGIEDVVSLDIEGSKIFRARQPANNRTVAVKLLDPFQDPIVPKRFEIRRSAASRFAELPGVVSVFAHGETEDGRAYLTMPFFRIGSLADQLTHGPMPWHRAGQLIMRTAEIVAKAGELGLVLGDLKPSSILLADADSPVIAYYGMAMRRFDDGSPSYAPPEGVLGTTLTPAADVYSLSLILAALIAGRPPNRGELSREFRAEVEALAPARIRQCIDRGLASHPDARFESARHFAAVLSAALSDDDGAQPPPPGVLVGSDDAEFDLEALLRPKSASVAVDHNAPSVEDPADEIDLRVPVAKVDAPPTPPLVYASETDGGVFGYSPIDRETTEANGRTTTVGSDNNGATTAYHNRNGGHIGHSTETAKAGTHTTIGETHDYHDGDRTRSTGPHPNGTGADDAEHRPANGDALGASEAMGHGPGPIGTAPSNGQPLDLGTLDLAGHPDALHNGVDEDQTNVGPADEVIDLRDDPDDPRAIPVAGPPPPLPPPPAGLADDEQIPFRSFDRQQAAPYAAVGSGSIVPEAILNVWYQVRRSLGNLIVIAGMLIIVGLVVLLVLRGLRPQAPTTTDSPVTTADLDANEPNVPSSLGPTVEAPVLAEPPATHQTTTTRRPATTASPTTKAPATTKAPITTKAPSSTAAPTTPKPPESTSPSVSVSAPPTPTTAKPPEPEPEPEPEGLTDPLIGSAEVSRVRATSAKIVATSPTCVTASFTYSTGGTRLKTVQSAGCSKSHTLLLGTVTTSLSPGTTYDVQITVSDGNGATASRNVAFTTLS